MMRTKERLVHVLQKQSSSAAVIFPPSHSSLLSPLLASDNYHVNPESDHPEAWECCSPLTLRLPVFREAGILQTAPHTVYIQHITSIRIPPQQDWFAWTAVVPSKHVYPARDPNITRVMWGQGSGYRPSGVTGGCITGNEPSVNSPSTCSA